MSCPTLSPTPCRAAAAATPAVGPSARPRSRCTRREAQSPGKRPSRTATFSPRLMRLARSGRRGAGRKKSEKGKELKRRGRERDEAELGREEVIQATDSETGDGRWYLNATTAAPNDPPASLLYHTSTSHSSPHTTMGNFCAYLIALFLPPLPVFSRRGCGADLLISIALTILGWLPGVIHACYIIHQGKKVTVTAA
ncbi:hypothetical protein IWX90DRAFT_492202 [Phyllosticta citrichinensis]|uniref:Uncharacterized protein n=1 Tax=Phyllosticta citrichinensis TaxID=1130410 RepID=A0ABR1Y7Q8_9PEZI